MKGIYNNILASCLIGIILLSGCSVTKHLPEGEVKLGDQVTVYADYGNSEQKAYPGEVTWISDRSEFTPKTILTKNERANLVYAVKIAVKNDGALKIGMYGGVKLKSED